MQPWVLIDKAATPDGTPLELWRRGADFSIRARGQELMSSRAHGSEVRLAELGVAALGAVERPRVLIGGLGCGYTLAAALSALGTHAEVRVTELSPAVVAWNRGVLAALAGQPLNDPRVSVSEADVIDVLERSRDAFDLILLDVDNGPQALTQARNAWLYQRAGLSRLWSSLRPSGVLGVWSAGPDAAFASRLGAHGFRVSEHRVQARDGRGSKRHTLWMATRSA